MIVSSLAATSILSTPEGSCRFIQIQSSCSTVYAVSFALPLNLDTGIGWNLCPKAPQKHHHLRARKRFLCQGSSTGVLWTGAGESESGRIAWVKADIATLYPPVRSKELLLVTAAFIIFHLQMLGNQLKSPHHLLIVSWPSYSPPSRSCFILPRWAPQASRRGHPPPTRDPKNLLPGWCLRQCDSWPAQMVNE